MKMDGEVKKSVSKKRSKTVEVGVDSDDNEPIGSLFKLRRPRISKNVNSTLENAEASGKKLVDGEEDSGGMDDTLASFRKRLKGPKRNQGSGTTRGKNSASNVVTSSSMDASSPCGGLENVKEGLVSRNDGSDSMAEKVGGSNLGNSERLPMDLKGSDGKKLVSLPDYGLQHSSEEQKEDSLSSFFQNAQCNLSRKSRASSSSKHKTGSQISGDGSNSVFRKSNPETVESRSGCGSKTDSALKSGSRIVKSSNDLPQGSHSYSSTSTAMDGENFGHVHLQEEISKGIFHSDIKNGLVVGDGQQQVQLGNGLEPMTDFCKEDSQQSSFVQLGDARSPFHQKVTIQEVVASDGSQKCSVRLHGLEEMVDPALLSEARGGPCGDSETKFKKALIDNLAVACNDTRENDCLTYSEKEVASHPLVSESLSRICENLPSNNDQLVSRKDLEGSSGYAKVDGGSLDTKDELHYLVSVGNLPLMMSNEVEENKLVAQSCVVPTDSTVSIQKCSSVLHQIQSTNGTSEEGSLPNDDHLYAKKGADGTSPPAILEETDSYAEYAVSGSEYSDKHDKISAVQRAMRKAKKRRHVDMAYEGDADWDILASDDRTLRSRTRNGSLLNTDDEPESVAAAVSAGLKPNAVGPVEKIRFKEILKRKGGLQDYLYCRSVVSFLSCFYTCLQLVFPTVPLLQHSFCITNNFSIIGDCQKS